jgi:hypothetical protein
MNGEIVWGRGWHASLKYRNTIKPNDFQNGSMGGHVSQSSFVNPAGKFLTVVTRRSTRIEKSVPLIVLGHNRMGEPFLERTVSVSLNKHGCRYPSRHDYDVGAWVTLQVVGLMSDNEKPQTVRAMVRSILPPASLRELKQVGVELEKPGNVWGIVPAPADWANPAKGDGSTQQLAAVAAPAPEPQTKAAVPPEVQLTPDPMIAEVTSFPTPSPAASRPTAPKLPDTTQGQRKVMTPDGVISALQGKLQQEVERAVEAALAKQVDHKIRDGLRSIEEAQRLSLQQVLQLVPKRIEEMKLLLKEEFVREMTSRWKVEMESYRGQAEETAKSLEMQAGQLRRELASAAQEYMAKMTEGIGPQIPARLNEMVRQATSHFERATATVVDRRYEQLLENMQSATQERLLRLNACSAEVQALAQSALNAGLEEFRRETDGHASMVLAETKERAVSALSSLSAESRAACEARRQSLEAEVLRSAEQMTEEFRKGMKTFLYSCLVAAVGAVDEHSRTTLDGLQKAKGEVPQGAREKSASIAE